MIYQLVIAGTPGTEKVWLNDVIRLTGWKAMTITGQVN